MKGYKAYTMKDLIDSLVFGLVLGVVLSTTLIYIYNLENSPQRDIASQECQNREIE